MCAPAYACAGVRLPLPASEGVRNLPGPPTPGARDGSRRPHRHRLARAASSPAPSSQQHRGPHVARSVASHLGGARLQQPKPRTPRKQKRGTNQIPFRPAPTGERRVYIYYTMAGNIHKVETRRRLGARPAATAPSRRRMPAHGDPSWVGPEALCHLHADPCDLIPPPRGGRRLAAPAATRREAQREARRERERAGPPPPLLLLLLVVVGVSSGSGGGEVRLRSRAGRALVRPHAHKRAPGAGRGDGVGLCDVGRAPGRLPREPAQVQERGAERWEPAQAAVHSKARTQ
eukprot:scaffold463_cov351-Prasinococcus_capsulatus_cf.AAC.5